MQAKLERALNDKSFSSASRVKCTFLAGTFCVPMSVIHGLGEKPLGVCSRKSLKWNVFQLA
jgi:hypothetical protein